jgi:glycosyltransferase 2 family protein
MRETLRKWWPALKLLLGLVVLFFVGKSLWHDLSEPGLWDRSYNVACLVLAGVLYILGLGCTMLVWGLLLRRAGQPPSILGLFRGYYVGLLGKYAPGKAWALLLRAAFIDKGKINAAVAVQTGFFEVMMMMATAGLTACALFAITTPEGGAGLAEKMLLKLVLLAVPDDVYLDRTVLVLFALIMAVPFLIIAFPPLFNKLVGRVTAPLSRLHPGPLPAVEMVSYWRSIPIEVGCWTLMGGSLCLTLGAVNPISVDWMTYGYVTAAIATACVAGFVILIVPSGLGVREYLLIVFLRPVFPGSATALAVVILRIVWTIAELIMAGGLYVLRPRGEIPEAAPLQ